MPIESRICQSSCATSLLFTRVFISTVHGALVEIRGIVPPMLTAFTRDASQDIDEEAVRNLTEFLIEEGAHALISTAGAGEYVYLSLDEWKRVNEIVVETANSKVPVVSGILDPGTRNVVSRAKIARDLGADAIMVLTNQYYFPSDEELFQHFQTIASESEMPVVLYNLTRISGKDVNPTVVSRLVDGGHVISIKESTRDFLHTLKLIQTCGNKATVLKGYAEDFLPSLSIGVQGTVTTGSNYLVRILVAILDNYNRGRYEKALELHNRLLPVLDLMKRKGDVAISKEALDFMGHPVGHPRRPLSPATSADRDALKDMLSKLDLLNHD
jgi:4-hydroxy-tetrahydrodipicolinate synthase